MAFITTIILTTFLPLCALAVGVEIREFTRTGNTVSFDCREVSVSNAFHTITDPMRFYLNSSSLAVATLLEERDIDYHYDSESEIFSFDVQQDLEGCYYCGNSTSLSYNCITIVAYPDRDQSVRRSYEVAVGQPVRILNGVGEGALASHYRVMWYKGFNLLTETERISYDRGDDFSLTFASVEMSDSDSYLSTVIVSRDSEQHYVEPEFSIELVVYRSPEINKQPTSVVAVQDNGGHGSVSFSCVASGGPNLRVSWMQNINRNLTSMPDPRYLITAVEANNTVTSSLVIKNATHLDSGSYYCVAYIMDRVDEDSSQFVVVANATLTVLDTKFRLQTKVTHDKELQIWITLQVPIPDPVRAVVYFTSTEDEQIQRHYVTSSSQTNSTALFFLLHFSDIPEDIKGSGFKVQVALKAGVTKGPLVPNSLEDADTRNINQPTEENSEECHIRIVIIITAIIAAAFALVAVALALTLCCYKWRDRAGRREYMENMPDGRHDNISRRIDGISQKIRDVITDNTITKKQKRELKKVLENSLTYWQGVLRGDDGEPEDTSL